MATNNFKPFATGTGANVLSQAEYEALAALVTGFSSGKASSAQINKAIRQATFIAAALAQYVTNKSGQDVLDDGDVTAFITKMATAFGKDFQALDAGLTSLAALAGGANMLPYYTAADVFAQTSFTAIGRSLIGQTTQANALSYLGGAPLASPTFTGTPTAPTATVGTNSTQLATTAFTAATLASNGIGQTVLSTTSAIDFQTFVFTTGANYIASASNLTNIPAGISYSSNLGISITVDYVSVSATRIALTLIPDTVTDSSYNVYRILGVGSPGSRVWSVRQVYDSTDTIPIANGGTGATTAPDALTALGAAPVASPTFTGTPAAPTATAGTSTTQLATTAFVTAADNLKAPLASPALTGTPTVPTPAVGTVSTQAINAAFVTQTSIVAGAIGRLVKSQLITSSASFTPQAATRFLRVRAIAGGGGSGGTPATASTTSSCGQAGFYGQYIEVIIPVSALTAPVTVTIGAGGAPGASGGGQGGTGGTTSFGSIFSLDGGPGGLWLAATNGANVIGPSRRTATITSTITPLASSNGITHAPRILQAGLSIASDNAADQSPFPGGYYGMGADGNIIGTSSAALAGVVGIGGAMIIEEYA